VAFANSLRGIAEVMPIMRNAFIAYVVIGLPLVYALAIPARWGLKGIYIAFTIALFTAGMLFMRRFYHKLKEMQASS
jgi:Na+-driven multidrug efflux pump